MVYAVVRVRGTVNINPDITQTLRLLRLTRVNHCTLIEETPQLKGMLQMVKDYTTWGELDKKTLIKLITTSGKLAGGKPLTDEYLQSSTSFKTIDGLAQAILDNSFTYREIPDVKPIFRLPPPRKGYKGIKRSIQRGGALGYRGKDINALLGRMLPGT